MNKLITAFILMFSFLSISQSAYADTWVNGYFRSDSTYVDGHSRSDPDGNFFNNWSTYGNINSYTGKLGTKTWDYSIPSYNSFNFDYFTSYEYDDYEYDSYSE